MNHQSVITFVKFFSLCNFPFTMDLLLSQLLTMVEIYQSLKADSSVFIKSSIVYSSEKSVVILMKLNSFINVKLYDTKLRHMNHSEKLLTKCCM